MRFGWGEELVSPHLLPSPEIMFIQQQRWAYCAKCPSANSRCFGCHPPVHNIPSCEATLETFDQMGFSRKEKKKKKAQKTERTLLIIDPGQVLITCHSCPFVSSGDGLLLCSQQEELTPAHSTQKAVLSFGAEV